MLGLLYLIIVLAAFALVCRVEFNRRRAGGRSSWQAGAAMAAGVAAGVARGLDAPGVVVFAACGVTAVLAGLTVRSGRAERAG